jgi:hypothetical protein
MRVFAGVRGSSLTARIVVRLGLCVNYFVGGKAFLFEGERFSSVIHVNCPHDGLGCKISSAHCQV